MRRRRRFGCSRLSPSTEVGIGRRAPQLLAERLDEVVLGSMPQRRRQWISSSQSTVSGFALAGVVASMTQPTSLLRAVGPLVPGAPLIFPDETADRDLASLAGGTSVDVEGNHYDVVLVEASAATAAAIMDFVSD